MGVVADRIEKLLRLTIEFGYARHELPRDRVTRIVAVDQARECRRQRDGIARGDGFQRGVLVARRKSVIANLRGGSKRRHCYSLFVSVFICGSATGVHITCSMRCAPVASITNRSKPSAMPDACGMFVTAAMISSSIG